MNERGNLIKYFQEENQKINLSSLKDEESIYYKHIMDSLELNKIFSIPAGARVADIGTGGGFPLFPLAITNPQAEFIGIEGKRKKTQAVERIIQKLGINNAKTLWGKAEEHKGKYDILTIRAVGYADKIFKMTKHLLNHGSKLVLYKKFTPEEDEEIRKQAFKKNFHIETQHNYKTTEDDIEKTIYILSLKN